LGPRRRPQGRPIERVECYKGKAVVLPSSAGGAAKQGRRSFN
jgi:hypothetical protein